MKENEENLTEQNLVEEAPRCDEKTKPAKPVGMGINAYCPCNNGVWGSWVDPHMAPE